MASNEQIRPSSVLVIGASGYIGFDVARAFRRAGYFVYGLIRNESKKSLLIAHEIIPVVGDAKKIEQYQEYIKASSFIIDCTASFGNEHPEKLPLDILKAVEAASSARDHLLPPKVFIYTSGIMVYEHDERVRDEGWPIGTTEYAIFRRKAEEAVISSKQVSGIVIRPGWVFGGSSGPWGDLLFSNPEKLVLYGKNHNRRFSWVHIDDLAESYVAAAIQAPRTRGLVFNIINGHDNLANKDVALAGAKLAGYKGELHWEEDKTFIHRLLDANVVLSPQQAATIFGWTPKIFGFLDNLEFYYEAYKASKALHK